jgi:XTP/dITP diphosphohydrolase
MIPLPERLVLASHNPGKVKEIADLLAPLGLTVLSAGGLGLPEPEESEPTFVGNALLKARAAALRAGLPALADDSGLAVTALGGSPGIYSARWAGPNKDFAAAMQRVQAELEAKAAQDYSAQFICVLALAMPDGEEHVFEGILRGRLTFPGRGVHGFGYDPIFVPEGETRTFGEFPPAEKHAISHRAIAFAKFLEALR